MTSDASADLLRTRKDSTSPIDEPNQSKRRRVSSNTDHIHQDWRVEPCNGADETLQIQRIKPAAASETTILDSYRLETIATGQQQTNTAPIDDDDEDNDLSSTDTERPTVTARLCNVSVSADCIAVATACKIHILAGESMRLEAVISHEHPVTCVVLSVGAQFAAFGDDQGALFIVHIGSRRVVYSQVLATSELSALKFTKASGSTECEELLVVADGGKSGKQLVRFSGIRLQTLSRAIKQGDMALAAEIRAEISVQMAGLTTAAGALEGSKKPQELHGDGVADVAMIHGGHSELGQTIVAGGGLFSLSCWLSTPDGLKLQDAVNLDCAGANYIRTQVSFDGHYLVALSHTGQLDVYERTTLTRIFRYSLDSDGEITDFGLVSIRSSPLRVAVVVNQRGAQQLRVVDLPSCTTVYAMDIARHSWLARGFDASIVFVEANARSFHIRRLSEALPLDRLNHFLRSQRFAAADEFARAHGIPQATVNRQRVQAHLDSSDPVDFAQIGPLLQSIDDADFVADACLRLRASSWESTWNLLRCARGRSSSSQAANVADALHRLGSWQAIGQGRPFDPSTWHVFRVGSLASCARIFMARGDIAAVSLLWRRHSGDAKLVSDVPGLLHSFPTSGSVPILAQWLKHEVLPKIYDKADVLVEVERWLEQRARGLESIGGSLKEPLLLAGLLVNDDKYELGTVNSFTPQRFINTRAPTKRAGAVSAGLVFLKQQLDDLAYLQQTHRIRLPLDTYAQMSYSEIGQLLLDRAPTPQSISAVYQDQFLPYARRHRLDHMNVLQKYCTNFIAEEEYWEPRILAIIQCLDSQCSDPDHPITNDRLRALHALGAITTEAMQHSNVPWSSEMDAAISRTLGLLQPYVMLDDQVKESRHAVSEQFRLMQLRRMLLSHGLGDFHISNTKMAQPLLQALVRKTQANIMPDVLQLVDAYHHLTRSSAYVLRLQALCETQEDGVGISELVRFIDTAEHRTGKISKAQIERFVPMEIVRRGLCWIREELDAMPFAVASPECRGQFRRLVCQAMAMLQTLGDLEQEYADTAIPTKGLAELESSRLRDFVRKESAAMTAVWQLLVDGGLMVSPGELEQRQAREQVLADLLDQQWLRALAMPAEKSKGKGKSALASVPANGNQKTAGAFVPELVPLSPIPASLRTLAGMLRFTSVELSQRVVMRCLRWNLLTMALDTCLGLLDSLGPPSTEEDMDSRQWTTALSALLGCEHHISKSLLSSELPASAQGPLIRQLTSLCQMAARKCVMHKYLTHFLNAYSCWDLAYSVYGHTTDGDFALLTKQQPTHSPRRHLETTASGSSRGPATGTSGASANGAAYDEDIEMEFEDAAIGSSTVDNLTVLSGWMAPLFSTVYVERGLVLATRETMSMVYNLASALRRLPAQSHHMSDILADSEQQTNGKGAISTVDDEDMAPGDLRQAALNRCADLVAHLAHNRHWMLAIQTLELTLSQLTRLPIPEESIEEPSSVQAQCNVSMDEVQLLFGNTDLQTLISKSLMRALQQQQHQRDLDTVFVFASMLMSQPMKAYQYLSTAMSQASLQPSRVIHLADIGSACSLIWQQQALLDRCRSVAAAARWSEQLQLLEVQFDISLLNDPKPGLLEPLVRPMLLKTNMDISTALEFAEAFRLDETPVILEYISLCCTTPGVSGYQARVLGIADEIANTKLLERVYVDCLNSISAYDYERLQFVIQRLQDLRPQDDTVTAKYSGVLDILCVYDRAVPPTLDELMAEWARIKADERVLTYQELVAEYPLSLRRLPFHALVNSTPWSTLLPELSADTIEAILPLSAPLDLNEDDFYMNLIDGSLAHVPTPSAQVAYELVMSKQPVQFNSVQHLIRCFKDPEAAISTIKHIAEKFPCGPDRVAALKMGIKLLQKWGQYIKRMQEPERKAMMTKAETIYGHFEKAYTDTTVEIALRRNMLETHIPAFINAKSADQTVQALGSVFEDLCARAPAHSEEKQCDVHAILQSLSAIYEIGLDSLLQQLLEKYLETPVLSTQLSQLALPSARYQDSLRQPQSAESVLRRRVMRILDHYSISDSVRSLLKFAYAPKPQISCLCRARALEIMFSLATFEDISELQQPENAQRYLQALLYLADFEFVGIPQSTAEFMECQKDALARSIWVEYHSDSGAVQLICNMCLDFGVDDPQLMLQIIRRLLKNGTFRYAVEVLVMVENMACYKTLEKELPLCWNQAVSGFFADLAKAGGEWIDGALVVLGSCLRTAYLPDIDTAGIIRGLLSDSSDKMLVKQLACLVFDVLPYSALAEDVLLDQLDSMSPTQIHRLIMCNLDTADLARECPGQCIFVDVLTSRTLTLIFDMLDDMGTHEQVLLNAPLGKTVLSYVQNRIFHDKLHNAVRVCLDKNKTQLARQLVAQYYQMRPEVLAEDAQRAGVECQVPETATSDDTESVDGGSPTGTQDISALAARKLVKSFTDQTKLDVYLQSRAATTSTSTTC
ncbi:hypothetical protein GGI07_000403 [Coemansia sp. Benny D115]|nr:hypothetical protein GGI07_000403 [Coemansia sp. Benny D115]